MNRVICPAKVPIMEYDVKQLFCFYIAHQVVNAETAMLPHLIYYKLQ